VREGVNGSDAVFLFLLGFSFTFRRAFLPFFYLLSGIPVFLLSLVGGGDGGMYPEDTLRPAGYQYDRTAIGGLLTVGPVSCGYLILHNLRFRIFEQKSE
jgi:hypothetical protein